MKTSRNRNMIASISLALVLALALGPLSEQVWAQNAPAAQPSQVSQVPQPAEGGVNWPGVGYGAGALFGNLLYFPAKLTYALLGSLIGGGAWLVTGGNTQTADTIWRSSLGGDYVLTPQMVAGEQPINFSGPTTTEPPSQAASAAPEAAQPPSPVTASGSTGSSPAPAGGYTAAPSAQSSPTGGQPMDSGTGPVPQATGPSAPQAQPTGIE
jgi:hypothetical protein